MTLPIYIQVDHREPAAMLAALQQIPQFHVQITHLKLGDYQIGDQLIFERKTLIDFAASIADGRLFSQATRLANSACKCAMILEGRTKDLGQSHISRASLQGALISISLGFGIPILRAFDEEESARMMFYAANQAQQYVNKALPRHGTRPKGKRKTQLSILQQLPSIGPARAQALLNRYGSIQNLVLATSEDLVQTPGIGQDTAERIHWAVNCDRAKYAVVKLDSQQK